MGKPLRILLQTTIPQTENDWTIERFSLLREYLSSLTDANRDRLIEVIARIREENGAGAAHFFHTQHLDPDESQRAPDDQETTSISWPNYHSGSNAIISASPRSN